MRIKKFIYKIWSKFLTIFGDIKLFKYPFFIIYDPDNYKIKGDKIEDLMNIVEPGDVIIRGYDAYIDSYFIKSERKYSHAGLYIGDNKIIHAEAPCVQVENIIDFCRCDRVAVIRPRKYKRRAIQHAKNFLRDEVAYDFAFNHGKETLYCFELIKECYDKLDINRVEQTLFFGLYRRNVVLSDQLFESPDFNLVFEYNPRFKIDFSI